jgi:uncharacterized membrane protein
MRARLLYFVEQIRTSYWFVPTLMAIAALFLAIVAVQVDRRVDQAAIDNLEWIYTGGPDGARAVLSTIAGSMITVAGVAFSITIVALSLASQQFGPRLLSSFMRDRSNQVVLGTFVATFLYCLMVLRTIVGGDEAGRFIPHLSVTGGVLLALTSLGVLIYFIHHVSMSIQAPNLVASVGEDLHHAIEKLFPDQIGRDPADRRRQNIEREIPDNFEQDAHPISSVGNGYIEAIDDEGLMEIAREHDLLLRLEVRPGKFVFRGSTVLLAWSDRGLEDKVAEQLRRSIVAGSRRTQIQDVEFSVNQLVEIAMRALSPGINDPFTAINCIDRLGAALCHLSDREFPSLYRLDKERRLRVIANDAFTFRGVVDAAFNQIRQNASYHVSVRVRLLEAIAAVMACAPDEEALATLLPHAEIIWRETAEKVPDKDDRRDIEERYRQVLATLERQRQRFATPEAEQPV